MAKNNVLKVLAGLAVAGAAAGGALAYIKKCKDVNDLSEEDFDDLLDDEEDCGCQPERTYTTLPTEDIHESGKAEENESSADAEAEAEETAEEENTVAESSEKEAESVEEQPEEEVSAEEDSEPETAAE